MTTLAQVGTTFVLLRTGRQPGPCSTLSGTPVVAGQFGGGWAPIGAEKTGDPAMKWPGRLQRQVNSRPGAPICERQLQHEIDQQFVSANSFALEIARNTASSRTWTATTQFGVLQLQIEAHGVDHPRPRSGPLSVLYANGTDNPAPSSPFTGTACRGRASSAAAGRRLAPRKPRPAMRSPGRLQTPNQFSAWNTDINGNYVSNPLGIVVRRQAPSLAIARDLVSSKT